MIETILKNSKFGSKVCDFLGSVSSLLYLNRHIHELVLSTAITSLRLPSYRFENSKPFAKCSNLQLLQIQEFEVAEHLDVVVLPSPLKAISLKRKASPRRVQIHIPPTCVHLQVDATHLELRISNPDQLQTLRLPISLLPKQQSFPNLLTFQCVATDPVVVTDISLHDFCPKVQQLDFHPWIRWRCDFLDQLRTVSISCDNLKTFPKTFSKLESLSLYNCSNWFLNLFFPASFPHLVSARFVGDMEEFQPGAKFDAPVLKSFQLHSSHSALVVVGHTSWDKQITHVTLRAKQMARVDFTSAPQVQIARLVQTEHYLRFQEEHKLREKLHQHLFVKKYELHSLLQKLKKQHAILQLCQEAVQSESLHLSQACEETQLLQQMQCHLHPSQVVLVHYFQQQLQRNMSTVQQCQQRLAYLETQLQRQQQMFQQMLVEKEEHALLVQQCEDYYVSRQTEVWISFLDLPLLACVMQFQTVQHLELDGFLVHGDNLTIWQPESIRSLRLFRCQQQMPGPHDRLVLEHFPSLEELFLYKARILSLQLAHLDALRAVRCSLSNLDHVQIDHCVNLEHVELEQSVLESFQAYNLPHLFCLDFRSLFVFPKHLNLLALPNLQQIKVRQGQFRPEQTKDWMNKIQVE